MNLDLYDMYCFKLLADNLNFTTEPTFMIH